MDFTLVIISILLAIIIVLIIYSGIPEFLIVSRIIRSIIGAEGANEKTNKKEITMSEIDKMNGSDFERFCADLLCRIGFSQIEVTGDSGDQGVDIIACKDGKKYAIQCKRYNQKLGNKPVQEVFTGKSVHNCDVAIVITNNHFTAGAREAAAATGVLLWDREKLAEMLESVRYQKKISSLP